MNDTEVSQQILQMVRFIKQEADEKAVEISVSAEEVSFSLGSLPLSNVPQVSRSAPSKRSICSSPPCDLEASRGSPPCLRTVRLVKPKAQFSIARSVSK